jgi:hypothetical protein
MKQPKPQHQRKDPDIYFFTTPGNQKNESAVADKFGFKENESLGVATGSFEKKNALR